MLTRLVIHDVVLIEKLTLSLAPGLNVFTGETGAGKSILLDALGLALGERSEARLVRAGAAQASVTAEFTLRPTHVAFELALEQGLTIENPLILRRVIGKDGKSRAFINDQPISVGLLKQFGERLLEIHGQFETHGLLSPATHRGLLDSFAGLGAIKAKTGAAFGLWKASDEALHQASTERERARAEEDFLRAAVSELDQIAPEAGEADELAQRRTQLQHREKILEALQAAQQALDGERGTNSTLTHACKAVARVSDKAPGLNDLLSALDRATHEAAEASHLLERFIGSIDAKPDALQRIEERLFALRACARKHGVQTDALPLVQTEFKHRLGLIADQGDQLGLLSKHTADAKHAYETFAENLSGKRKEAAAQLEKAVGKELPPLKFERARFTVDVTELSQDQWSAEGMDHVSFQAATNPGSQPGALQKIASGGELARFMLALKVVLAASDPVPVLVFDEVDSGIGGATASAVGERLARLAKDVQILVVTHSPQVAARGTNHLRVSKEVKGKHTSTDVETLNTGARREEIARMLAGAHVTDAARQAALSLLEDLSLVEVKPPKRHSTRKTG